jgi:Fic family protein
MEMYHEEKKWIWEGEGFPHFVYDEVATDSLHYKFGQLKMLGEILGAESYGALMLDVLMDEAVSTSAIEGEIVQRSSVRSSINKLLKLGIEDDYGYTRQSDALIEVILDAKTNVASLTKERLFSWHRALFVHGSGLREIATGRYRTETEPMQIVSGAWHKEKIHYVAPPADKVDALMEQFLHWLNAQESHSAIHKAAVAHLYFVLIHPFEDGNGRIARAITDYVLAKANLANANFYSVSTMIYKNRKAYYGVLDEVCVRLDQDISKWVAWFVDLLERSIDDTLDRVEAIKTKTKFWDRHKETSLNQRQKKAITKMLSVLPEKFEGGMRVHKYMSLAKTTRITASRDLNDLVEKSVMQRHGSGRGVYYELRL